MSTTDLAAVLEAALAARRMTVREFARVAGVHENSLYGYASGRVRPRPETARRIADALGVDVGQLLGGLDPGALAAAPGDAALTLDEVLATRPQVGAAWRTHAACVEADPELFWPHDTGPPAEWERPALQWCARCPVLAECRDDALARDDVYGVDGAWDHGQVVGGTTAADRAQIRRLRERAA